jgi:hypothetical protein
VRRRADAARDGVLQRDEVRAQQRTGVDAQAG